MSALVSHGKDRNQTRKRRHGGFTLIELLIVAALIALMASLVAPSLQGLFGVAGRRGGASLLAGALEQARLAAIENGVKAYVGFPLESSPAGVTTNEVSMNSFIVFRDAREDELSVTPSRPFIPLSRWIRLPKGVFVSPESVESGTATNETAFATNTLAALSSYQTTYRLSKVRAVEFDRFGKLIGNPNLIRAVNVGEGVFLGNSVTFRPGTNDFYRVQLYPMTGRVKIVDNVTSPGAP
jgi:prepilin-type N-terminal cleavage/methylation domain-containing protein